VSLPDTTASPVTVKVVPSNVKLLDAVAAFGVPSLTISLFEPALFIVENPVPLVPDVPELPDEPDVPLEPDDPDVPELPDEPDVPELPDEPDDPDVPELPDEPDVPELPDEPDEHDQ
jgi:hypothetical protein